MNWSMAKSLFARRTAVSVLLGGVVALFVATLTASQNGAGIDRGGASPYVPTKGEWLCLLLNSRQALVNSGRAWSGVTAHYLYDQSKPDTIRIQVRFTEGIGEEQANRCLVRAEQHAIEAAKVHGWQDWLKIEREKQRISDAYASDALMR